MRLAKIETDTLGEIVLLLAFLVVAVLIFTGVRSSFTDVGTGVALKEYVCWATNLINHNIGAFPTTCRLSVVNEPVKKEEEISALMRKCYWMYGQGEWDIADIRPTDRTYQCYAFTPDRDISLSALKGYMLAHSKGETARNIETDYNFLQEGNINDGVCIDKAMANSLNEEFKKGRVYYIIFRDDRGRLLVGRGLRDRILISENPDFDLSMIDTWYQSGSVWKFVASAFARTCLFMGEVGYIEREVVYYPCPTGKKDQAGKHEFACTTDPCYCSEQKNVNCWSSEFAPLYQTQNECEVDITGSSFQTRGDIAWPSEETVVYYACPSGSDDFECSTESCICSTQRKNNCWIFGVPSYSTKEECEGSKSVFKYNRLGDFVR